MKKFLPLLLLVALPVFLSSCEDDPWEVEMMGEYWSDDVNPVHFVLRADKTGYIEYGDGSGFEFGWYATPRYITFMVPPYSFNPERWECEYRWSRGNKLVIYDFDQWGDLVLYPNDYYYTKKKQAELTEEPKQADK